MHAPQAAHTPSHLTELNADATDVQWCELLEGQCLQVDLLWAALVAVVVQHDGQDLAGVAHLRGLGQLNSRVRLLMRCSIIHVVPGRDACL